MKPSSLVALALAALSLQACQTASPGATSAAASGRGATTRVQPDLPVSMAPHQAVEVNWKQRLEQPYAYLEARGSYTGIGALLEEADRRLRDAGVAPAGPPFALFYDDPGTVPVSQLRMRACFPVEASVELPVPLSTETLPSTTVVYAFVGGAYPEVPRAYPSLFAFMDELGWALDGPVREIYLVHPGAVSDWNQLVAEVQLPATSAR